jgi:hypothetical protein
MAQGKGRMAKAVGKAGATGGENPALPTALGFPPKARAGFANSFGPCCWQSKLLAKLSSLPTALSSGFANSMDRCCWQTKLLAKLSFPLPIGLRQQPSLPCW